MKKKYLFTFLISFMLLLTTDCGTKENKDALKFKEEYESLNNIENNSGKRHRTVTISEDNPFVYATGKEIVEKIENKETFYVYFGSAYCPWCRSAIEKAIEVAQKNNIDKIYYVNIWDGDHVEILRDTYILNDKGKLEQTYSGGEGYQKLLKYFDSLLGEYTLTDKDGNKVSVGEKRIFAPNYIYVEKGEAKKLIEGTSDLQKDSREELTEEILNDEEKIFQDFFTKEN